jgi:hypothetical protein
VTRKEVFTMARKDQIIGLNNWAQAFTKNAKKEENGNSFPGILGDEYPLHKYTFPDGQVYYEKVEAVLWESGPCFYLALVDEEGNWVPESLWLEE